MYDASQAIYSCLTKLSFFFYAKTEQGESYKIGALPPEQNMSAYTAEEKKFNVRTSNRLRKEHAEGFDGCSKVESVLKSR